MTLLVLFHQIIWINLLIMQLWYLKRKGKYSFIIANTDSSEKEGTHWRGILDIEPKQDIFFFDPFGQDGLKCFLIQDNQNVIKKILFGTEKMTRTDNKITIFNILFNLNACKNLSADELDALSYTASNFFHFIQVLATSSNYVIV